jgi:hypothetical protein
MSGHFWPDAHSFGSAGETIPAAAIIGYASFWVLHVTMGA